MDAAAATRTIARQGSGKIKVAGAMIPGGGRALYLPHDPLTSLDATAKVQLLERVERIARAKDPRVKQVMASLSGEYDVVLVARADGDPQHAAYVQDILFGQTVHRYATPTGHLHSPAYFLGIIAVDWLPLSLLLPWAIPAWWRRLRRGDARFALPLGWFLLVLVFFSISPGKRDVYILPALPMTALALAPLLPGLLRKRQVRWAIFALTAVLSAVLTLAATLALTRHPAWATRMEQALDPQLWWPLLSIGGAGLFIAACTRIHRAPLGWLLLASVLWGLYGLWAYPMLNGERSARDVMAHARAIAGPDATIGLLAWKEQNLLMARGPVTEFGFLQPWPQQFAQATAWLRADPGRRWVFSLDAAMGV
jgi:4-amino-4-deoxy-L-arabinose transferase-like glycosyltransferase